ncbi:MAG: class I SAM-dependent methyltransferase [Candidatus Omnitrophica bacterium]|nr:class I SAM-dependent methyltransferase [Candidatus Omnitrophota bacterium]
MIINMLKHDVKLAQNTFSYFKDYLSKNDLVLDVGTGNGLVAKLIRENIGAQVTGIDVIDINRTEHKTLIFNGQNIPFKDNQFTVTICTFVLHHVNNQRKLLLEIRRVTQSRIIIFEDVYQTFFDKILGFLHRFPSIFRYQSQQVNLKSSKEWEDLFANIGLILEKVKIIKKTRDLIYPISRRVYILKKQSSI